jgi:diguanylate cyclase (GGDEF)-like protein
MPNPASAENPVMVEPGDRAAAQARAELDAARAVMAEPARALRLTQNAITLARTAGDQRLLIQALQRAAVILSEARDFEGALPIQQEALEAARSLGDPGLLCDVMNTLGNVFGATYQFEAALQWYERAEAAALQAGDGRRLRMVQVNVACKYLNQGEQELKLGRVEVGRSLLQHMLELSAPLVAEAQAAGDKEREFVARCNRAAALVRLERHREALHEFEACVPMARSVGLDGALLTVAIYRVRALRSTGQTQRARQLGADALSGAGRHDLLAAAEVHEELSQLEEEAGDPVAALRHHRAFHSLHVQALNNVAVHSSAIASARLQAQGLVAEAAATAARAHQLSLENMALAARAEAADQAALTDPLTGLANRRRLDDFIRSTTLDQVAAGRDICVALVDIDHFKQINDRFGHPMGDQVLRSLAAMLRRNTRTTDLAARFGGEEFVILFASSCAKEARQACERIRSEVEHFHWAGIHPQLSVTISIGVSRLPHGADVHAGLEIADKALYRAKNSGRNRVCDADA